MFRFIRRTIFKMFYTTLFVEMQREAEESIRTSITAKFQQELDERTNTYEKSIEACSSVFTKLNGNVPIPEGDNVLETIEAYQNDRFFQRISEDVAAILSGGTPEASSEMLLEYFNIKTDGEMVLDATAKQLHRIIKTHYNGGLSYNGGEHQYERLPERIKKIYRKYAMSMWHDQKNISNHAKK